MSSNQYAVSGCIYMSYDDNTSKPNCSLFTNCFSQENDVFSCADSYKFESNLTQIIWDIPFLSFLPIFWQTLDSFQRKNFLAK